VEKPYVTIEGVYKVHLRNLETRLGGKGVIAVGGIMLLFHVGKAEWCTPTTYLVHGRNMQLCGSLGQLKCIMRIADDSNYIFLADKLVPDCWQSVPSQFHFSESLFLFKFSSICQVCILKDHMQSCPEEM